MLTDDVKSPALKRPARFVPVLKLFVLEIDSKPILAFEARSAREARELTGERWLLDDLRRLTSNGRPLWDGTARLRIGPGDGDTAGELQQSLRSRVTPHLPIAYLLPIDGET